MTHPRLLPLLKALESLGENAWQRNIDTDELYISPGFWRSLGYEPDEAPDQRLAFSKLIHPQDVDHVRSESARFLSHEDAAIHLEFRVRRHNGLWRWINFRGREVLRKNSGEPHIAIGIITDVSDLRREQAAAVEYRELLAIALEGSGAGFWDLDLRSMMLTFDERSLQMHGLPIGLEMPAPPGPWLETVDPEFRDAILEALKRTISEGAAYSVEYTTGRGERWINGMGKTILESGKAIRFAGLAIDITERKRAERTIEAMRVELLQSARASAMAAMAGTLAHELNQPLTSIANYSTGALRIARAVHEEQLSAALEAIQDNAHRAGTIIRKMREMARSGSIQPERIEINQLLMDAAKNAKAGCEGTSFHLDLKDGATVYADPVQIQQVLVNLIRNACQAMDDVTSSEKTVTITTKDVEGAVMLVVDDQGPGIPPDMLSKIFDADFTTKTDGMGIGLSISRTIVEAHGGHLWAENTPEGARFCFTLPIGESEFALGGGA